MKKIFTLMLLLLVTSCGIQKEDTKKETVVDNNIAKVKQQEKNKHSKEEKSIKAEEEEQVNNNLAQGKIKTSKKELTLEDKIKNIRTLYNEIQKNRKNYITKVVEGISDQSSEGAERTYFFENEEIKVIQEVWYGDMGKKVREYYLHDRQVFFVFDSVYSYNAPINIEEGNADGMEAFDEKKTKVTSENRYYFYDDTLIQWINEKKQKVPVKSEQFQNIQKEMLDDIAIVIQMNMNMSTEDKLKMIKTIDSRATGVKETTPYSMSFGNYECTINETVKERKYTYCYDGGLHETEMYTYYDKQSGLVYAVKFKQSQMLTSPAVVDLENNAPLKDIINDVVFLFDAKWEIAKIEKVIDREGKELELTDELKKEWGKFTKFIPNY